MCLIAAALKTLPDVNVLIATPSDFLAKYAEETFGIHLGLGYNQGRDSYVSFSRLSELLTKGLDNTFILIDELDSYLFENPIEQVNEEDGPTHSIRFKMRLLQASKAVGILGMTGTLDKLYGVKALDLMF